MERNQIWMDLMGRTYRIDEVINGMVFMRSTGGSNLPLRRTKKNLSTQWLRIS